MSYLSHLKILLRSINIASQTKVRDLAHLTVAHQYISSGQIPVNKLTGKKKKKGQVGFLKTESVITNANC